MNWPNALRWLAVCATLVMCGTYVFLLAVRQSSPDSSPIFMVHLCAIPLTFVASLLVIQRFPIIAGVGLVISVVFAVVQFWFR